MRREDQRRVLYALAVAVTLLVLSLSANVHLFISKEKGADQSAKIVSKHMKDTVGYLNGLEKMLDIAKNTEWSDSKELRSICDIIKHAQARISMLSDLTTLTSQELVVSISSADLEYLWFDFNEAWFSFAEAADNVEKDENVNSQALDQFREKVKRAKFPNQDTVSWHSLGLSISRYFSK